MPTNPFLDDPLFILFLIGCGFFLRAGTVLFDFLVDNLRWLWRHSWKSG